MDYETNYAKYMAVIKYLNATVAEYVGGIEAFNQSATAYKKFYDAAHASRSIFPCHVRIPTVLIRAEGKIIQRGKHRGLMNEDGLYKGFVNMRERTIGWELEKQV